MTEPGLISVILWRLLSFWAMTPCHSRCVPTFQSNVLCQSSVLYSSSKAYITRSKAIWVTVQMTVISILVTVRTWSPTVLCCIYAGLLFAAHTHSRRKAVQITRRAVRMTPSQVWVGRWRMWGYHQTHHRPVAHRTNVVPMIELTMAMG